MAGTVSRWFHRKRGLALGIAATGMGFGAIFIVPLSAWLISVSGWRTAYMILGATAWIFVIPLSRLLRKNPGDLGLEPDGSISTTPQKETLVAEVNSGQVTGLTLREASRTRSFWFLTGISHKRLLLQYANNPYAPCHRYQGSRDKQPLSSVFSVPATLPGAC